MRWKASKTDHDNGGYNNKNLTEMFEKVSNCYVSESKFWLLFAWSFISILGILIISSLEFHSLLCFEKLGNYSFSQYKILFRFVIVCFSCSWHLFQWSSSWLYYMLFNRSSRPKMFLGKGFLKICSKLQENTNAEVRFQ